MTELTLHASSLTATARASTDDLRANATTSLAASVGLSPFCIVLGNT